jgi:hypothetical protein
VLDRFIWPSQRQAVRVIAGAVAPWPEIGVGMTEITGMFRP